MRLSFVRLLLLDLALELGLGAAVAPAGPSGYSFELVPAPVLFPEPRNLSYGNATLRLGPATTTYVLSATASRSPILVAAAARFLPPPVGTAGAGASAADANTSVLTFPWGVRLPLVPGPPPPPPPPFLVKIDVDSADENLQHGVDESYTIEVSAEGAATLRAATVWGGLHALETFSQLVLPASREPHGSGSGGGGGGYYLPLAPLTIEDAPHYSWRGLMLDTSRRWYPLPILRRFVDAMAQHKLNVLQ